MNQLNRRELLASFLAAPVALNGCARREPLPPLPPGEIVGASAAVGHRLRQSAALELADDQWQRARVVIIGGGIAGLAAARTLLRAGVDDFVLLELEDAIGGTSRSGTGDVVSYPWGAHYVPAPTRENLPLVELFDELDVFEGVDERGDPVVAEPFRCRFPQERLFYKGRWYDGLYLWAGASADDLRQWQAFQREIDAWVSWRDGRGRRAFAIPMASGSDDPEVTRLDQITMAEWMDERHFSSDRLRWLVDYSCRDDYGLRLSETSAWAGLFYFASRRDVPGGDSRPFITWPEGNGRIVSHLYRQVKSQCRLGWAVLDVNPGANGIEVIASRYTDSTLAGWRADKVIFAAPQFLTRFMIRPYCETVPAHVSEFQYSAWAVANVTLTTPPQSRDAPLAWDNVLYESPSLGYVSATHQRGMDYGTSVLTYYYPLCAADPVTERQRLLDTDRDAWADVVLTDLEVAHPELRQTALRLDVMRWGHAMIRPTPGFVWGGARQAASRPFRGIHFAHADLSGIALFEEAFFRGMTAAEQVVAELQV